MGCDPVAVSPPQPRVTYSSVGIKRPRWAIRHLVPIIIDRISKYLVYYNSRSTEITCNMTNSFMISLHPYLWVSLGTI